MYLVPDSKVRCQVNWNYIRVTWNLKPLPLLYINIVFVTKFKCHCPSWNTMRFAFSPYHLTRVSWRCWLKCWVTYLVCRDVPSCATMLATLTLSVYDEIVFLSIYMSFIRKPPEGMSTPYLTDYRHEATFWGKIWILLYSPTPQMLHSEEAYRLPCIYARMSRQTHQEMFTVYKHKTHTSRPVHCSCDFAMVSSYLSRSVQPSTYLSRRNTWSPLCRTNN